MDSQPIVTESATEFRDALGDGGALLALDLGTRTIGIATCDARWTFATAGKTLEGKDLKGINFYVKGVEGTIPK